MYIINISNFTTWHNFYASKATNKCESLVKKYFVIFIYIFISQSNIYRSHRIQKKLPIDPANLPTRISNSHYKFDDT